MTDTEPQSIKVSVLKTKPQDVKDQFFSPEAVKYKDAFPGIIRTFTQLPQTVGQTIDGEEGKIRFRVSTPKLRIGKHAQVALVEIYDNWQVFECAFAQEYLDHVRDNPAVAEFVPRLYAVTGNWAVLKRIHGSELAEVDEKMKSDPQFLDKFAQRAFDVTYKAAQK